MTVAADVQAVAYRLSNGVFTIDLVSLHIVDILSRLQVNYEMLYAFWRI